MPSRGAYMTSAPHPRSESPNGAPGERPPAAQQLLAGKGGERRGSQPAALLSQQVRCPRRQRAPRRGDGRRRPAGRARPRSLAGPGCPLRPPLPPTPWSSAASACGDPGAPHSPLAPPLRGARGQGWRRGSPAGRRPRANTPRGGAPAAPGPAAPPTPQPPLGRSTYRGRAALGASPAASLSFLPPSPSSSCRPQPGAPAQASGVGSPGRTAAGDGRARRASGPGRGRQVRSARLSPARPGPGAPRGPGASEGAARKPGTGGRPGLAVSERAARGVEASAGRRDASRSETVGTSSRAAPSAALPRARALYPRGWLQVPEDHSPLPSPPHSPALSVVSLHPPRRHEVEVTGVKLLQIRREPCLHKPCVLIPLRGTRPPDSPPLAFPGPLPPPPSLQVEGVKTHPWLSRSRT